MDMKKLIRNFALLNAVKHEGKAAAGSVIGSLIAEDPRIKSKLKEISKDVAQLVNEVNKMSPADQEAELRANAPELLVEKEKKKESDLKELEGVDPEEGVIMRFAPSPSGPMHIGHAMTGGLTSLYVKKYGGKFILRIEDTNSDNIDPDAYEMLPKDGDWLFGNVTDVWIQSDRMKVYYDYVEKFIDKEAVYVCTCSQDEFKKYSEKMEDCPCRSNSKAENTKRWKMMFDSKKMKEGDAVLRFKAGMKNKNPAMRDFPLARINDSEHPRQGKKYRVWPLMNLAVTVDDIEAGMTHTIRAKDHADNAKRQEMMYKSLGLEKKYPINYFVGRYNFEGLEISCSKTKAKINQGLFTGWDDIRVPFIVALKRRGYRAESFIRYTKNTGISLTDKTVSAEEFFKGINAINKELLDPIAKRFFFIENPVKIKIEDASKLDVELDLHPDSEKGGRRFKTNGEFFIAKHDMEQIAKIGDGEMIRLMDCLNFVKKKDRFVFDSIDYENYKNHGKLIIHWLPADEKQLLDAEVLMPDNKKTKGKIEGTIANQLMVDDVCQLERFGFARLDAIDTAHAIYKFWFAHR